MSYLVEARVIEKKKEKNNSLPYTGACGKYYAADIVRFLFRQVSVL